MSMRMMRWIGALPALLLVPAPAHAVQCSEFRSAVGDPRGYREVDGRCEGSYLPNLSSAAALIEVVGFHQFDMGSETPDTIVVSGWPNDEPEQVTVSIESLAPNTWYRADQRGVSTQPYRWSTTSAQAIPLAASDFGFLLEGALEDVPTVFAARFGAADVTPHVRVYLRPSQALTQLTVSLFDPNGDYEWTPDPTLEFRAKDEPFYIDLPDDLPRDRRLILSIDATGFADDLALLRSIFVAH